MLIDDRQIKSVDVNKVFGLARVGITNSYTDLTNIPKEFTPKAHSHNLATSTSDGFMSSADFNKLSNLVNFANLNVINADNTEFSLKPNVYSDTLKIKAGNHVVFKYEASSKSFSIDVDYTAEISKLKGEKGDPGKDGKDAITWKPYVNNNGELSFSKETNPTATPPTVVNIRGPKGEKGDDASPVTWNNLVGKPVGDNGDVTFIDNLKTNGISTGKMLYEGIIATSASSLSSIKTDSATFTNLQTKYKNYILNNFKNFYIEKSKTYPQSIAINSTLSSNVNSSLPMITLAIDNSKENGRDKLICFADNNYHRSYNEIEVSFKIPIGSSNPNMGAVGILLGFSGNLNNTSSKNNTLSFMIGFNQNNANFDVTDNNYNNLVLVANMGSNLNQNVITRKKLSEFSSSMSMNGKTHIFFRMKAKRVQNNITCWISSYVTCNSSDSYTALKSSTTYNDSNKLTVNLTTSSLLQDFIDVSKVGICYYNMTNVTSYLKMSDNEYSMILPIYGNLNNVVTYLDLVYGGSWNGDSNETVLDRIGYGKFIKNSLNGEILFLTPSKEITFKNNNSVDSRFSYVNNYVLGTTITSEPTK